MTQDQTDHEQTERVWFRRIAVVLMLVGISFGAIPVVKGMMYPVVKVR
jgi:hypothetical protein